MFHPAVHPGTGEMALGQRFESWDPDVHSLLQVLQFAKGAFERPEQAAANPEAAALLADAAAFAARARECVQVSARELATAVPSSIWAARPADALFDEKLAEMLAAGLRVLEPEQAAGGAAAATPRGRAGGRRREPFGLEHRDAQGFDLAATFRGSAEAAEMQLGRDSCRGWLGTVLPGGEDWAQCWAMLGEERAGPAQLVLYENEKRLAALQRISAGEIVRVRPHNPRPSLHRAHPPPRRPTSRRIPSCGRTTCSCWRCWTARCGCRPAAPPPSRSGSRR